MPIGFLKNMLSKGTTELKKIENKDLMEAIVGGSLLVAAADGDISDEEILGLSKRLESNPNLKHFGNEIGRSMNHFEGLLDSGFRVGKMHILREISDIKNNPDHAEEVFVNMVSVAEEDGDISDKELAILAEVGTKLGIRLADFGL